jgi:hypothetical protein
MIIVIDYQIESIPSFLGICRNHPLDVLTDHTFLYRACPARNNWARQKHAGIGIADIIAVAV